jgi:uncharacterized protein YtpQ (UPF0354 family)
MARKSTYDQLVDSISKRLREMAPENCQTIEEAVRNDQTLSNTFGMMPSSAADYSYCPNGHVCWHGVCQVCE